MNITIIGLGETGTAIAHELMVKYQSIRLNILDSNENLEGRILDLAHAGVANNNRIAFRNDLWFRQSDFIFFCAGTRNLPGESREIMAQSNKTLIAEVFQNSSFKQLPVIIVISNPVDAMATWISNYLGNKALVFGTGTLLDTWRLKLIIAEKLDLNLEDVNTAVIGEHGETMVVLWSQTTVNGLPITDIYGKEDIDLIEKELRLSAKKIRQTENATKYGVGAVALYLLGCFLSAKACETIASIKCEKNSVFYGQSCLISSQGVRTIDDSKINESERNNLGESIDKIRFIVGS